GGNCEAIVHPPSFAPGRHNARPAKVRQMSGDFRLADPKDADEVADAHFPVRDQVQQTQARGIRERAKEMIERAAALSLCHMREVYNTSALTYMFLRGSLPIYSRRQICRAGGNGCDGQTGAGFEGPSRNQRSKRPREHRVLPE